MSSAAVSRIEVSRSKPGVSRVTLDELAEHVSISCGSLSILSTTQGAARPGIAAGAELSDMSVHMCWTAASRACVLSSSRSGAVTQMGCCVVRLPICCKKRNSWFFAPTQLLLDPCDWLVQRNAMMIPAFGGLLHEGLCCMNAYVE